MAEVMEIEKVFQLVASWVREMARCWAGTKAESMVLV